MPTKRQKSRRKHARQRPSRPARVKGRRTGATTAVIPIALQKEGKQDLDSAVIPVALTDAAQKRASETATDVAAMGAVIPIAVANKRTAAKRRRGRSARRRVRATAHGSQRRTKNSGRETAIMNQPAPNFVQTGVEEAIEFEEVMVDAAAGIGLLTLDVLQTAAMLVVRAPATFMGTQPYLPSSRATKELPLLSAIPALPAAA